MDKVQILSKCLINHYIDLDCDNLNEVDVDSERIISKGEQLFSFTIMGEKNKINNE